MYRSFLPSERDAREKVRGRRNMIMGMNIAAGRVHNFRGFRDVEFAVGQYNLLAGSNNSGKIVKWSK